MSESPNTENDGMIPPERALEHLSVEKAWHLLNTLSSQVVGKQTELQVGRNQNCGQSDRGCKSLGPSPSNV